MPLFASSVKLTITIEMASRLYKGGGGGATTSFCEVGGSTMIGSDAAGIF